MTDISGTTAGGVPPEGRTIPNGADEIGAEGNMAGGATAAKLQDAFGSVAGEVQTIVRDRMDQVRQAAGATYQAARERGGATKDQMDEFVRARPWEAVSFAGLIGLAIGLYIAR